MSSPGLPLLVTCHLHVPCFGVGKAMIMAASGLEAAAPRPPPRDTDPNSHDVTRPGRRQLCTRPGVPGLNGSKAPPHTQTQDTSTASKADIASVPLSPVVQIDPFCLDQVDGVIGDDTHANQSARPPHIAPAEGTVPLRRGRPGKEPCIRVPRATFSPWAMAGESEWWGRVVWP